VSRIRIDQFAMAGSIASGAAVGATSERTIVTGRALGQDAMQDSKA
jgi:hypothetical protein